MAKPVAAARASPHESREMPQESPRERRQRALSDARRAHVLDAARTAFIELGLEGASLREIARRAGYTPGAIYSYFASKEEVYFALLGESLQRLQRQVQQAAPADPLSGTSGGKATPSKTGKAALRSGHEAALRLRSRAFFDYYREHPRDLDLGFYLFQGMQPRGLTPALNEPLNAALRAALAPVQSAMLALGLPPAQALAETTALFAHIVGLLVLSHTGRIRMFRQPSAALFERYLDALVARCHAAGGSGS